MLETIDRVLSSRFVVWIDVYLKVAFGIQRQRKPGRDAQPSDVWNYGVSETEAPGTPGGKHSEKVPAGKDSGR